MCTVYLYGAPERQFYYPRSHQWYTCLRSLWFLLSKIRKLFPIYLSEGVESSVCRPRGAHLVDHIVWTWLRFMAIPLFWIRISNNFSITWNIRHTNVDNADGMSVISIEAPSARGEELLRGTNGRTLTGNNWEHLVTGAKSPYASKREWASLETSHLHIEHILPQRTSRITFVSVVYSCILRTASFLRNE